MDERVTPARPAFEFNRPVIVSGLFLLSVVSGLTLIIGVILAYTWKGEAEEWERSHFHYLILTFWMTLAAWIAGVILLLATFGSDLMFLPILGVVAVAIWVIFRSVKSLVRAGERRPIGHSRG
jgi:uncharacterized membrane protein